MSSWVLTTLKQWQATGEQDVKCLPLIMSRWQPCAEHCLPFCSPGFLNTADILGWIILVVNSCPVPSLRGCLAASMSSLYTLDARSTPHPSPSPSCDNEKHPQTLVNTPCWCRWGQNGPHLRTTDIVLGLPWWLSSKESTWILETQVQSLGQEDGLE